jgi:hypothetical protein
MFNINLIGDNFAHAHSSTWWKKSKYFQWMRNMEANISMYIDNAIIQGINVRDNREKYGWILESRVIIPDVISYVKTNYERLFKTYKYIFTHYKELLDLHPNFKFVPAYGFYIEEPKIYNKTKLVSMISSNKVMCEGHKYRLKWVDKLKPNLDLYGRGFKEIQKKETGLNDYMFSVAIENDSYNTYFTEKILDCFSVGTIPIYHGSPNIGEYFNIDGIIVLDDDFNIKMLTEELYLSKMDAIKDNYNRVLEMEVTEDWIYKTYFNGK